jgi:hypothetical protein
MIKPDKVPIEINVFFKNGTNQPSLNFDAIAFADTIYTTVGLNSHEIQRVEVIIDPQSTLTELTKKITKRN